MLTRDSVAHLDAYFPVIGGVVTAGFWEPRPLSGPKPGQYHRAWDITARRGAPILAEEDGQVIYHVIYRSPTTKLADQKMPDGKWYWLSNLYRDNYGCMVILRGKSGLIYVHCHLDEPQFFSYMRDNISHQYSGAAYEALTFKEQRTTYNEYVAALITDTHPVDVSLGQRIGAVGNSGYSTGAHVHVQIHAAEDYNSRIDPAELWPKMTYPAEGGAPGTGIKPGADFIPA